MESETKLDFWQDKRVFISRLQLIPQKLGERQIYGELIMKLSIAS